ncbi:uroporphyrinogen-III synthase [Fredinandcohnia quinoae]|uniref:Uroporphyrinogen-III synthase n=1 Tax=Fredinandcohnia quinoae TaxID=2918902 RepID=A0AAW5EBP4_9BACI|nr:uroporphyrinogen-III synthase [Fredinandcohnia sp. SECRCQ15]MCH1626598.1 uroporphyrinogen-III synthase [Fredinandcohnia sp. SECRCQ15]
MESEMPLLGKKILVTRGKKQATEFSSKIKYFGGIPIEVPLLTFQESKNAQKIKKEIEQIHAYDWLIFTSKNGVEFFFDFYEQYKSHSTDTLLPKIAVVGTQTEKTLVEKGYKPDLIPDEFVAEGLFESLKPYLKKESRIILARGNLSRPFLVDELSKLGHFVTDLIVYETVENQQEKDHLSTLLQKKDIDIITFTSPSTVTFFCRLLEDTDWGEWVKDCIFAAIGPITLRAAELANIHIQISPKKYTIDDLLDEIIHFLSEK